MDVVASSHPRVVPCVEVQLSVRHGREAVTFYEAAFGEIGRASCRERVLMPV